MKPCYNVHGSAVFENLQQQVEGSVSPETCSSVLPQDVWLKYRSSSMAKASAYVEEFVRQLPQFDQHGKSLNLLRKNLMFLLKRWNDSVLHFSINTFSCRKQTGTCYFENKTGDTAYKRNNQTINTRERTWMNGWMKEAFGILVDRLTSRYSLMGKICIPYRYKAFTALSLVDEDAL